MFARRVRHCFVTNPSLVLDGSRDNVRRCRSTCQPMPRTLFTFPCNLGDRDPSAILTIFVECLPITDSVTASAFPIRGVTLVIVSLTSDLGQVQQPTNRKGTRMQCTASIHFAHAREIIYKMIVIKIVYEGRHVLRKKQVSLWLVGAGTGSYKHSSRKA